ncbi:MAG: AEC family transporter [Desulfotalea sp.]
MNQIFAAAFPVFAIMLVGLWVGRINFLGPHAPLAINKFVFYISLPCLLFNITSKASPSDLLNLDLIGILLLGSILSGVICIIILPFLKHKNLKKDIVFAMNSTLGNTAYMGIPILMGLFGPKGAVVGVMGTIILNAISAIGTIFLSCHGNYKEQSIFISFIKTFRSPFIIATIVGFCCSILKIQVPLPLENFASLLGSPTTACALFAVGLSLAKLRPKKKSITEASLISFVKIIICPLIVLALCPLFPNLDPIFKSSAVILAATPVGVTNYLIACENDCYTEESATAVFISTICSILTLLFFIQLVSG